ncbi:SusD/RagB family nutrient-binding outer membrane lipoprotein [Tenacibaculum agarivorans]|uniref:SusD/RagB family nutrient-binding outer membrane lipoprotein n=1 Tax=Tenacibaculum agarivorans TaxID=1908389 RepID=UPI00094B815D|nr:SusD/RagB family nutrient-binding outer membrane lipoprotein [Tenacibaculum agarivorans]
MKKINKYALIFITALLIGCDKELSELNIDPNNAIAVPPSTLLTTAQYNFYTLIQGVAINADWGNLMVQQWSQNEFTEDSRYRQDINTFNGTWQTMYASILAELSQSKKLVDDIEIPVNIKNNQKAIIDVMSTQVFGFLTDGFGAIPYTEALGDSPLPAYDSQEVVYKEMLSTLENALSNFSTSSSSFDSGEIIFNGDVSKWIKLTNSLMLRYAMRIADVDADTARKYVIAASNNLISSNSENALFVFEESLPRANPLHRNASPQGGNRDDYAVSELLVTTLNSLGDPRLEKYAKPNNAGIFAGMPFGLSDNDASVLKATTSRPNDAVREATTPHVIISYAEVQFLLAEAYERGFLSGNASDAYNQGITASMNYWNVTDTNAINTYLINNPYNTANWKESIGIQKWLALYMNGFEAWNEWRRLDFPQLSAPAAADISTIPVRMPYPLSETQTNSSQLSKVTSTPGSLTEKVWWDVN